MLGDFITRFLLMVFGYAYPAFQCFKTVEKNRVEIEELRFWCRYWIIVASVTVMERVTDIIVSWFPMYGELKLAFILYLWHPRTTGAVYVYENLLGPFVKRHENDIDRTLKEWRARGWDLTIFYWKNCAMLGQNAFVQILQLLVAQTGKFSEPANKDSSYYPMTSMNRAISESPKFEDMQVHQANGQAEFMQFEEDLETPRSDRRSSVAGEFQSDENIGSPHLRFRRTKPVSP